ncbi:MAG: glycosyltransferase family 1 protein [Bacteroidetes bacterium]|nr:MAG: glycosyltransferase family 1 protein [Bacteroidota bacterium]TAG88937.1 MAG: glycosyltransferase family 1 protein [Bacteroidota bacterium]
MEKKKIMLDMTMLKRPHTGLGQFSLYLGNYLLEMNKNNIHEDYQYDFLLHTRTKPTIFSHQNYTPRYFNIIRKNISIQLATYTFKKYDLWHTLSQQSAYFPFNTSSKIIYTIHDLNFLKEENQKFIDKKMKSMQKQVERADIITAISNYAADDVYKNFDLKGKKIEVVYNGIELKKYQNPKKPSFIADNQKFIFTIGSIMEKKNFHTLVPMMKYLPEYKLVIAGKREKKEYIYRVENEIQKNNVENQVILTGEITDEDRYWLYQNCEAFVFPSLLEGFGMPIVEALSVGKPVFSSSATSLPEVGGELVDYWHHFEPESMFEIFKNGIEKRKKDVLFAQKAIDRANEFTWKIAADKYFSLYKDMLK